MRGDDEGLLCPRSTQALLGVLAAAFAGFVAVSLLQAPSCLFSGSYKRSAAPRSVPKLSRLKGQQYHPRASGLRAPSAQLHTGELPYARGDAHALRPISLWLPWPAG